MFSVNDFIWTLCDDSIMIEIYDLDNDVTIYSGCAEDVDFEMGEMMVVSTDALLGTENPYLKPFICLNVSNE